MANRWISFGYKVADGYIKVNEKEAEIVKNIFEKYIEGNTLKQISDELTANKIEFDVNNCNWNKNKVFRIIGNSKYLGNDKYPKVVDDFTYRKANAIMESKGNKKLPRSKVVDDIIGLVYCKECGKQMYRRSKTGTHGRWRCHNQCQIEMIIDDDVIISEILNVFKSVKDISDIEHTEEDKGNIYNIDSIRYQNEIAKLLSEKSPTFQKGKNLILRYAGLKFQLCQEHKGKDLDEFIFMEINNMVSKNELNGIMLKRIIKKINIDKNGQFYIELINDRVITDK